MPFREDPVLSDTWPAVSALRDEYGISSPEFVKTAQTEAEFDRIFDAIAALVASFGAREYLPGWKTAQLADGQIVGRSGATLLEAQISIEVWRGSPVVWIVQDASARVHERYLGQVSTAATRSVEARTYPVTPAPVEHPTKDGAPVEVQGTFDFGLL